MRTIGIIAAMEEEIQFLKDKMDVKVTKSAVGAEFYIGSYMGKNIVLVKSGIGKVNAAVCTQALIDLFAVDYIINSGVAGGVYKEINIGDIVISTDAVHHDFDCSASGGYAVGVIPRMNDSFFKADETLIAFAERAAKELGLEKDRKVYTARIASGDIFVASKEHKKKIWDEVGAYCSEMEGAAIAQACYLKNLPFLIIRATSDKADNSATDDFDTFCQVTAKISSSLVEKIIEYV